MFYNKYSDYSPEQITSEQYEALCNKLLAMARNNQVKEKMKAILYEGGYGDFSVNTELMKNDEFIERKKRIGYTYILATNPETADILVQNNINIFHGTNANALPNILKYGMQSVDEQANNGIVSSSGEEWSRINGKRDFISFTDDIDTALDYASISPKENKLSQESFGVLIGMSSKNLRQLRTCSVHSDLPEIGIMGNLPLEYINSIAVPEDKVEFVRKLVGDQEIIVLPVAIDEKFYYISSGFGEISIDTEKAKKIAKKTSTRNKLNSKDMSEMSKTRKSSGIRYIYEQIKERIINYKGKMNEEDTRDK